MLHSIDFKHGMRWNRTSRCDIGVVMIDKGFSSYFKSSIPSKVRKHNLNETCWLVIYEARNPVLVRKEANRFTRVVSLSDPYHSVLLET